VVFFNKVRGEQQKALLNVLIPAQRGEKPDKPRIIGTSNVAPVPHVAVHVALEKVVRHAVEGAEEIFQVPVEALSAVYVGAEPRHEAFEWAHLRCM